MWGLKGVWSEGTHTSTKGGPVEEEREKVKAAQDEQDVEAHRTKGAMDDSEAPAEPGRRETDEEADVEAHRHKA
jgi:hypothetical protein